MIAILNANEPGTVSLVTLGPFTNLAMALAKDAAAMKRLRKVFSMGGAINVPGNVLPHSEFNIFGDPEAADIVFCNKADLDILLLPLDVTTTILLSDKVAFIADTQSAANATRKSALKIPRPLSEFVLGILEHAYEFVRINEEGTAMEMHDPLVIAVNFQALSF